MDGAEGPGNGRWEGPRKDQVGGALEGPGGRGPGMDRWEGPGKGQVGGAR